MPSDLDIAIASARAGAEAVRSGFDSFSQLRMKGTVDPVTEIDEAAERAVFDVITETRSDDDVLGEESGGAGWDSDRIWIVDPLDGTVNFIHGIGHVAVSVALWERGVPRAACVIDVTKGEEFTAAAGHGCHLNGAAIRVSETNRIDQALIVTGFPYDRQERAREYAGTVAAVLARVQGIRRLGSAALDLGWVAAGRFDGYWEFDLGAWDVAAGLLLVEEAGGVTTDHEGEPYRPGRGSIVSGNREIQPELASIVEAALPAHLR